MAGDWIKMRAALIDHPKVIAVSRRLHQSRNFRDWLCPGGGGALNGQIVSDGALRCVTCALLLRVWSGAREHGKFDGDDLVLAHNQLSDLDQMAGVSGFGEALESVGWAISKNGVTLPNFKQYNVPLTPAERQQSYRSRRVTDSNGALRKPRNNRVTREEKRREDNKEEKLKQKETKRFVKPTVAEVAAYCLKRKNQIDPEAFVAYYEARGWRCSGSPMKSWQSAIITWEKNYARNQKHSGTSREQARLDNFAEAVQGFLADNGTDAGGIRKGDGSAGRLEADG